jgi:hypothetical protein
MDNVHRELREKSRAESILDRRIPLGYATAAARPEIGQTVQQYYRAKHSASGPGHGRILAFASHGTAAMGTMIFMPALLSVSRRRSFLREFEMFFRKQQQQRPSKAQAADAFRQDLRKLTDRARGDGARFHDIIDGLEAEGVRLRTQAAITEPIL